MRNNRKSSIQNKSNEKDSAKKNNIKPSPSKNPIYKNIESPVKKQMTQQIPLNNEIITSYPNPNKSGSPTKVGNLQRATSSSNRIS